MSRFIATRKYCTRYVKLSCDGKVHNSSYKIPLMDVIANFDVRSAATAFLRLIYAVAWQTEALDGLQFYTRHNNLVLHKTKSTSFPKTKKE